MNASLGECLKQLRTERGLSLEAIARRTRIHESYLQALEDNDLSKLPPALLFAKAYMKAYSRCLALTEDEEAEVLLRFVELANGYYRATASAGSWAGAGLNGARGKPALPTSYARVRLFR